MLKSIVDEVDLEEENSNTSEVLGDNSDKDTDTMDMLEMSDTTTAKKSSTKATSSGSKKSMPDSANDYVSGVDFPHGVLLCFGPFFLKPVSCSSLSFGWLLDAIYNS